MVALRLEKQSNITERRQAVSTLFASGKTVPQIISELHQQGYTNPRTGRAYSRTTIINDLKIVPDNRQTLRRQVSEVIGNVTYTKPMWQSRILLHVDYSWRDYVFWDALRRGMAPGYQIGGMFCEPIIRVLSSFMLGSGIRFSLADSVSVPRSQISEVNGKPTQNLKNAGSKNPSTPQLKIVKPAPPATDPVAYTNSRLKVFGERIQGFIQNILSDELALGNQFVVINPDATLSVLSPETVTVEYSASDYRFPIRYIVRTKMEKATVEDIYTAEKRTIRVHYYDDRGTVTNEYENLIGRIPIIHFANDRSANEIYGRPIYEAALPVMRRYDDLIDRLVSGVELISNPIPVIENLDNPGETLANIASQVTYTDEDGNAQTHWVLRFDRDTAMVLGKGGKASFLAPPVGFTKDSLDTLRQLFLLLLSHARIPEHIWGGAVASSKASTESQMPPFIQYIKARRLQFEGEGADPELNIAARGGILELVDIWLRTYKLLNPSIVVGPVRIEWPDIDAGDAQQRFLWGSFLRSIGDLTPEDTVKMSGYFDDPAAAVGRAAGRKTAPPEFDEYGAKLRQAKLALAKDSMLPPDDDGQPYRTDWVTPGMGMGQDGSSNNDDFSVNGPLYYQHMLGGGQ